MKHNIKLYIDGVLADVDNNASILFNYKHTDATNPAAVFNSYSQQLTLPPTSANNAIFGHIMMLDRHTTSGKFNALQRTPFVLFSNTGEIVEKGYLKLDSISKDGYTITLYGGLGEFLYNLMYDQDGNKRTLASLDFGGGTSEFDFEVSKKAVADAWKHISGTTTNAMYDKINFAPAYEGLPTDFDTDKAFCPTSQFGVVAEQGVSGSQGATMYKQRDGYTLCKLDEKIDGWKANDLRSYLQRPVIRMKSVIDAICNPANNGGYSVNLDSSFFRTSNPHYDKLWLTLNRLDSIKLPVTSGSAAGIDIGGGLACTWTNRTRVKSISLDNANIGKGVGCEYHFTATITPTINAASAASDAQYYAQYERTNVVRQINRLVVMYQLLAYNSANEIIGGSKVYGITTKIVGSQTYGMISPAEFVRLYNLDSTNTNKYLPYWRPNASADDYMASFVTGEYLKVASGSLAGSLTFRDGSDSTMQITLNMTANGVHHIALVENILSGYQDTTTAMTHLSSGTIRTSATSDNVNVSSSQFKNGNLGYTFESVGSSARSGVHMTKGLLLGGTQSPADYLISYIKQYNLRIICHKASKEISILSPNTFYDGEVIDLTDRLDRSSINVKPYSVASRWYDFTPDIKGAWADDYKSKYGKTYGQQIVNTGFEFDAKHTEVIKDYVFKGAAEVLESSKYFVRVADPTTQKNCPSAFISGGKQILWSDTNEAKEFDITTPDDTATIGYLDADYKGYDYQVCPKIQLHDSSNKSLDGADILLFYRGSSRNAVYSRYTITDDNALMMQYNDGKPCWLVGQESVNENYAISTTLPMPIFGREVDGYTLDFGTPAEIDNPAASIQSSWSIYSRYWAAMFADRYDGDSKVVTADINLHALGGIGTNLMRHFYWYDGALWMLNAITNYQVTDDGLTSCELVKVADRNNYTNGQNI